MIINSKKLGTPELTNTAIFNFDTSYNLIGATLHGPVITGSYGTVRSCSVGKPIKRMLGNFGGNQYLTSVPSEADLEYVSYQCFRGNTALTEVNMSSLTRAEGSAFVGCTGLLKVSFPKLTIASSGTVLCNCTNLQTVQIGSLGNAVTNLNGSIFQGDKQSGLTITVYTDGAYANTALANARAHATNATIIIRASADTAYGGTAYSAGDAILTDAPSA